MKAGYFHKPADSAPTAHLFIANCGPAVGISEERVQDLLTGLGALRIDLSRESIVCASFDNAADAEQARASLASPATKSIFGRTFVVKFADYVVPEVSHAYL